MNKEQINQQFAIIRAAVTDDKPDRALEAVCALAADALVCLNMIAGRSVAGTAGLRVTNTLDPSSILDALNTEEGENIIVNIIKRDARRFKDLLGDGVEQPK